MNMTLPKIDESSFSAREQRIIDTAIVLIAKHGLANTNMDKLTSKLPYSKGTLYNHFKSKEDLFMAISNRAISILSGFFQRAAEFEGCSREKMLLLNFSYLIFAALYPELFQTTICTKSPSVYKKSSSERINENEKMEQLLLNVILDIIEKAKIEGTLTIPTQMSAQQVCFANWSMNYGTITLLKDEIESCSGRENLVVEIEIFNQNNILFDGLQWSPLTKEKDYRASLDHALQNVFKEELSLMKDKGRELFLKA